MSFFSSIKNDFEKLFGKAPSVLQQIGTTLKIVAPFGEEFYALVTKDPADAAEAANVVAEIETDITAAQVLISQSHNSADATTYAKLETLANSLKGNLQSLLTAGHIKDPGTVEKVTGIVNLATGEVDAVLDLLQQQKPQQAQQQAA